MAKMLWKAARWLMGVGLIIVGGRSVPEPSSTLEQPWREVIPWPWLQANWVALACFVLAAVLLSYSPIKWWIDRQNAKDLRQRVRTNLIPGQFDETDAADALNYLLRESAWGHREYARLNHWGIVNGFHLREFARAAERGDIVTLGWSGGQGRTLVIDRRYWREGRIEESTSTIHGGVMMEIRAPGSRITFSQLAVATADLKQVWPRATLFRRAWAATWVWLKRTFWYGSILSNSLEERRRLQRIKDRRLN